MITFSNSGNLDIRAAMTFGVSAKESDNPFGQFGTGLKYAVAILLRTGHAVEAYSGGEYYSFSVEKLDFRGKAFGQVCMNGQALGFTTHLGSHWEVWQAYRELYCNAMDEPDPKVREDYWPEDENLNENTHFLVEGDGIIAAHRDDEMRFLREVQPLYMLGRGVTVYQLGEGMNGIYLKGVQVQQDDSWQFSYNLQGGLDLTEDRTAKYSFQSLQQINAALSRCSQPAAIQALLTDTGQQYRESDLTPIPLEGYDVFTDTVRGMLSNHRISLWPNVVAKLREMGLESATRAFQPSPLHLKMLDKACAFCTDLGYDPNRFPIEFVQDLGTGIEAQADFRANRILLTKQVFNKGTRYLASTLLEEVLHLETGFSDCSRSLQTHLFDMVISLGERVAGEPL